MGGIRIDLADWEKRRRRGGDQGGARACLSPEDMDAIEAAARTVPSTMLDGVGAPDHRLAHQVAGYFQELRSTGIPPEAAAHLAAAYQSTLMAGSSVAEASR